jgi:hypothetical protein
MRRETTIFSSASFDDAQFRLHGRTRVHLDGRVLHVQAWGPFNLELVQAQSRLLRSQIGPNLPPDGQFFELISYFDSILMPEDAWACLYGMVDAAVAKGVKALGTVVCIGDEVEGSSFFADRLVATWGRSRPALRARNPAQAQALLAQLQAGAPPLPELE